MIGENIRRFREALGISQEELAHRTGVHSNTIARWERAEVSPRGTSLTKLAQGLGISPAELFTGETDTPERAPASAASDPRQEIVSNAQFIETVRVPLIGGVVKACCGPGNAYASEVDWKIEGALEVPKMELFAYEWQVGPRGFATIRVEGNSMEPRIYDGDIILFGDLPYSNGNFVLVKYDDRIIVRGIWDDHNGHYRLRALNPAYEDIEVDMEDESKEFIILGKVIRRITMENLADGMM